MTLANKLLSLLQHLVVAVLFIGGAVAAFRFGLLPVLQSTASLDDATLALLRRSGIFITMLLAYVAFVRVYEKRVPHELTLQPRSVGVSLLAGFVMIALVSSILFAVGVYEMTAYRGLQVGLLEVAAVILVAATMEELIFRALLFAALERRWGTLNALWMQSVLFSVLHIANLNDSVDAMDLVVTVASGTLIGVFWTLLYIYSRNVWVVAANHAAWNFTVVMTGLPLSGLSDWQVQAPLESTYHGPNWLTGGSVGPEDSILTIGMVLLSAVALFVWLARHRRLLAAT